MMNAALTLHLSQSQAAQLCSSCAAYRAYAWQTLPPTTERNQIMKAVQAVQGRLSEVRAGGAEPLWLTITEEEKNALRQMVITLMQAYGGEAPSVERHQVLIDLGNMRVLIERLFRQTQTF